MLLTGEGVSVTGVGTPYCRRPCPTWPAPMAMWSVALPMTASCLPPQPGFDSFFCHLDVYRMILCVSAVNKGYNTIQYNTIQYNTEA